MSFNRSNKSKSTRPPYVKGRDFEYYVIRKLERNGYYCVRSAGSHTHYDVVAIGNGHVLLIQCRIGRLLSRNKILEAESAVRDVPNTIYVIAYSKNRRVRFYIPIFNKSYEDVNEMINDIEEVLR